MRMIIMKHKIILFSILCALFSVACVKEHDVMPEEARLVNVIDEDTALRNFSVALSKAICSEQPIREFIKKEALKQVDNDYDVFYPFVKNSRVDGSRSFRDVICQYLGGDVIEIENAVPTLTILVPDMTWLDPQGFCAENWNTSDGRAAVTYKRLNGSRLELFVNGYDCGELEEGSIPGGAVFVVKSNERISAEAKTKSGEQTFHFIDDAFDGSKNEPVTKDIRYTGKYSFGWITGQDEEDSSDELSSAVLDTINLDIIRAYDYFKTNSYACQNDYIYYGMTSNSSIGKLKSNVKPRMLRFKINPRAFNSLFDESSDRKFEDVFDTDDNGGKRPEPTVDQIYSHLWADGALEICIEVYTGNNKGVPTLFSKSYYSVRAKDLFTIKPNSISKETWGSTMIKWYVTWQYKLSKRDETTLSPKWYYPDDALAFPTWDLLVNSGYTILVFEEDSGNIKYLTQPIDARRADSEYVKIGTEAGLSENVTAKLKLGWTGAQEKITSTNVTIRRHENDDDMGLFHVLYGDKCIKGYNPDTGKYTVSSYTTGDCFTCTILPCKY